MEREVKIGMYRHFKGHLCKVVGVAKHSEDQNQEFVIYEHTDDLGNMQLWARPKGMFLEEVVVDGKRVLRFEYLGK